MNLQKGVVCGLLGKNGVGKTTLLYLISGLLKPQAGEIKVNGEIPVDRNLSFLNDIFLVPEEFGLPSISLSKYIEVNSPLYPKFDMNALEEYLSIFDLTPDLHLGKLSMGQKKKVFISFAMACNTSVLLLDEPTNGMDISSKRNFRKAIAMCMSDEKSILISTHQVYDVEKILDQVIIIDKSRVLLNASMSEIQSKYKFNFTSDRHRASQALVSLEVPGGMNIAELVESESEETEVNLETLFEMAHQNKF